MLPALLLQPGGVGGGAPALPALLVQPGRVGGGAGAAIPGNMPISRDPLPRWDRPACASLVSSECRAEIQPSAEPPRHSLGTRTSSLAVMQQQTGATHG